MLIHTILIILIFTTGLLISFWALLANRKSEVNRLFFFLTSLFNLNILFTFFSEISSIDFSLFWVKAIWVIFSLLISCFYFFALNFPKRIRDFPILNIAIISISVIFSYFSAFSNLIISNIEHKEWGLKIIPGPLMNLFYLVFVLSIILGFFIILKKFFQISKLDKAKIKYFLVGFSIYVFFNVIFGIVFPLAFGIEKYYYLGDYSIIFFFSFTAYAIIKHRLMDIRMVVARSVAFMIMMVGIVGFSAGFMMYIPNVLFGPNGNDIYSLTMRTVFGLIMVFGFQPFRRFITKITDKIFFKNDYDLHDLIKKITNNAYSTLILIELLYKTIDLLIKEMKATRGLYVLLDKKGNIHTTQSIGYKVTPEISAKDASAFSKHGILLLDDLSEGSHFKRIFKKLDASIAVGLLNDGVPVGVLFLGEKNSGDMYNTKDIKLFEILAPEMVISIQRAEEHEKVQNFNVFLQSEVARKTKELQEANDHLLELDKAKDEFISMASHQLRTPLTAIKGYLSMLLEGDAGEIKMSQYDFVNEAFSAGNRMVALIDDLLNVSRMDTGRFFLEPAIVDLEKIVQEEMKQLSNSIRDKKLYIKLEKKKTLPMITVDETKIRQVIMNFIDNAVYYTVRGGITVILDKDSKNVIFKVQDTGIGVPEKAKNELFTKFFRAENARTARPDGTGLGIYLARKVIEDHGGEIIFDSTEGKGSLFGFKIPIKSKIKKEITSPPEDLVAQIK